jgi:hypothetical protein
MSTIRSLRSDNVGWYKTLTITQRKALLASNLGWLFDGFETHALILTASVAATRIDETNPSTRNRMSPIQTPTIKETDYEDRLEQPRHDENIRIKF